MKLFIYCFSFNALMLPIRTTILILCLTASTMANSYVNQSHTKPWRVLFYPKKSLFKKADLIDRGCGVFIKECPQTYKQHFVCARHYDGQHKTFNNYCEMEYENCNSWRSSCSTDNDGRVKCITIGISMSKKINGA